MKKKFIITLSILLAIIFTSAISYAVSTGSFDKDRVPSEYKIGTTYDAALESDKPMIALFYVDWCGYCKRFMPKFNVISKIYRDKYNVVMINAEDPANKELADDVALSGFPTLFILDPKYDNRVHLNNGIYMDMKKMRVEFDRYLRIRELLDKAS